jgi:hypothetical protein
MKFKVSYSYELPHYADFIVVARNKQEAMKKANKALRDGRFRDVGGQPNDTVENERVFVCGRARKDDVDLEPV